MYSFFGVVKREAKRTTIFLGPTYFETHPSARMRRLELELMETRAQMGPWPGVVCLHTARKNHPLEGISGFHTPMSHCFSEGDGKTVDGGWRGASKYAAAVP